MTLVKLTALLVLGACLGQPVVAAACSLRCASDGSTPTTSASSDQPTIGYVAMPAHHHDHRLLAADGAKWVGDSAVTELPRRSTAMPTRTEARPSEEAIGATRRVATPFDDCCASLALAPPANQAQQNGGGWPGTAGTADAALPAGLHNRHGLISARAASPPDAAIPDAVRKPSPALRV